MPADHARIRVLENLQQALQEAELSFILAIDMKHPVVLVSSIILCLIIVTAAFIALVAINSSKLDASSRADIE